MTPAEKIKQVHEELEREILGNSAVVDALNQAANGFMESSGVAIESIQFGFGDVTEFGNETRKMILATLDINTERIIG